MVMDAGPKTSGRSAAGQESAGQGAAGAAGRDTGSLNSSAKHGSATPSLVDPRKLAHDWITLWQSELSAMATDPEIRETWRTVTASWVGMISNMLRTFSRDSDTTRHDGSCGRPGSADASRPAPVAAAPDARDVEIERLARQVAALERRLEQLEHGGNSGVDGKSRAGRKPRK